MEAREDQVLLRAMLQQHVRFTGSEVARRVLGSWERECRNFTMVYPLEFRWVGRGATNFTALVSEITCRLMKQHAVY